MNNQNSRNFTASSSSFLRRLQAIGDIAYTPSVPEESDYRKNFTTFAEKAPEKKQKMANQMQQIAVLLEQRRIVPSDEQEHRLLAETELSKADRNGAASLGIFKHASERSAVLTPASMQLIKEKRPDGNYDMLEF